MDYLVSYLIHWTNLLDCQISYISTGLRYTMLDYLCNYHIHWVIISGRKIGLKSWWENANKIIEGVTYQKIDFCN